MSNSRPGPIFRSYACLFFQGHLNVTPIMVLGEPTNKIFDPFVLTPLPSLAMLYLLSHDQAVQFKSNDLTHVPHLSSSSPIAGFASSRFDARCEE